MIRIAATLALLASITAQPALAQRQLQCEPGTDCSVTCYQAGLDSAPEVFNRDSLDTLQVDIDARVLKMEFRDNPNARNTANRDTDSQRSFDYFILGADMSCTINNMHGVHD